MARKPSNTYNSGLKFRPGSDKSESKGMKPLPEPTAVNKVLLFMLQYGCRKLVFINTFYRVIYYLSMIFLVSVVVDFIPAPKIAATRKDNFFNQYFVKVGWGWTLLILLPFVSTTSFVYCCGKRRKIIEHVVRLAIATGFWLFWTNLFNYIETIYGRCNVKNEKLQNKSACLGSGYFWQSVDISGHCFLLIYSTLVMIEEARVVNSWEGISNYIIDEEYSRTTDDGSAGYRSNPLKFLDENDFNVLKNAFPKITPYVRSLFIALTILTTIWEFMLLGTVFYYHSMLEKFLAALCAVITWYLTYYIWYPNGNIPPCAPGDGHFKYKDVKQREPVIKRRQASINPKEGPKFMGMPIRRPPEEKIKEAPNHS